MKFGNLIFTVVLIISLSTLTASKISQKAPGFELKDGNGNLVKLTEINDKLVLIDFWATWCVPCKKALPHLSKLQEKYPEELAVVVINIDKPRHKEKAKAYIKSNGYAFKSLYDPEQVTMKQFNVVNPPRTVLIAPGMNIIYTHDGYKRGDEIEIEEAVINWLENDKMKSVRNDTQSGSFFISGINKMSYVYRSVEDSLHHYMDDEFSFTANYNRFRFGMTYRAELPEYDRFSPDQSLNAQNIDQEWVERFAEFRGKHLFLRAGNFETVFGNGMVLHAYNNTDMNDDERLEGIQSKLQYDNYSLQAIYGSLPSDDFSGKDDIVLGADFSARILKPFTIGASALSYRGYVDGEKYEYNQRDVFSGRFLFSIGFAELNGEYAACRKYRDIISSVEGNALYSNLNLYLGKFRITTAYKNYKDFSDRLMELPTVNHCEEPIADNGAWSIPGFDEEGLQTILSWIPVEKTKIEVNYSEAWAEEADVEQSDFFGSFKHEFDLWSLNLEYTQMERMDYSGDEYKWDKEIKPHIEIDLMIAERPVLFKFEWKKKEYDNYGYEHGYNESLFQVDYGVYKNYSLSLMNSFKYNDDENYKSAKGKLGFEIFAPLWQHTDIRLFAGSEKGGKVCRNGVCNFQAPFDGVRLDITTRF